MKWVKSPFRLALLWRHGWEPIRFNLSPKDIEELAAWAQGMLLLKEPK